MKSKVVRTKRFGATLHEVGEIEVGGEEDVADPYRKQAVIANELEALKQERDRTIQHIVDVRKAEEARKTSAWAKEARRLTIRGWVYLLAAAGLLVGLGYLIDHGPEGQGVKVTTGILVALVCLAAACLGIANVNEAQEAKRENRR